MRALRVFSLAIFSTLGAGCVFSENGLALPDGSNVVFDPGLLGDWVTREAEIKSTTSGRELYTEESFVRIERKEPGSRIYRLTQYRVPRPEESGERPKPLVDDRFKQDVQLIQIGDAVFIDAVLNSHDEYNGSHVFGKLKRYADTFDVAWLKKAYFGGKRPGVRHRVDEREMVVLTASSDELRAFFRDHANDPAVWEPRDAPAPRRRKSDSPAH